jgi:hypothetical protein
MSLETYIVEAHPVEVGGKTLAIVPLRVRQVPAFVRAIAPATALLSAGRIADAVALHGDGMIVAMAVATGEAEDMIGDLLPDEFLRLVAAVMEVNGDFFVQRVAPQIAALQEKAEAAMKKATSGATSSPSSSATATA